MNELPDFGFLGSWNTQRSSHDRALERRGQNRQQRRRALGTEMIGRVPILGEWSMLQRLRLFSRRLGACREQDIPLGFLRHRLANVGVCTNDGHPHTRNI